MKYWLDAYLNRVTMYRLVIYGLAALFCVSLLLSVVGVIPYRPVSLIASVVTLISVTYLSNRIFGWLFSVVTHGESSLITALILFFLFTPTSHAAGLSYLALVGIMASGSKYLLAVRGRHIFNPAAVAAVIVGWFGLTFATWWVATPPLLPITILVSVVILYKTRRMMLGTVFVGLAFILIVLNALFHQQSLVTALASLGNWPLLFFAGFMLSEPLTLPPRHWQQLSVGAMVAVLFALPFHLPGIGMTPAFALCVGNGLAFLFGQRRAIQLTFQESRQLTPSNVELMFTSQRPLRYQAGQYVEVNLPHQHQDSRGARRMFSLVSAPGDQIIRLGIKLPASPSSFKQALQQLTPGARVAATGINGSFVLPSDRRTPLLFIAGGIGITPFISQLIALKNEQAQRDIVLVYAVSGKDEIAYRQELREAGIAIVIVTPGAGSERLEDDAWQYVDAPYITQEIVELSVDAITNRHAYISGPPPMVESVKRHLKYLGVQHIKTDYFTGY